MQSLDVDAVDVDMKMQVPQEQKAYTVERLVADAVGVVKALGHERCTLVAHDWGGIVGWWVPAPRHTRCAAWHLAPRLHAPMLGSDCRNG